MKDQYNSIKGEREKTLKIERSKFVASAIPVATREEAEKSLEQIRARFFDATHNGYAYAVGSEREIHRYSDDGEPSGTAGVRILAAIESRDLSDLLVVVTRYFGGVKLGVGGLGRAYYESAVAVLAETEVVPKTIAEDLEVVFPYDETNGVMTAVSRYDARIVDTLYGDDVALRIRIRRGAAAEFLEVLRQVTRGNLAVKPKPSARP